MFRKSIISVVFLFSLTVGTARAQMSGCEALGTFVTLSTAAYLLHQSAGTAAAHGLAGVIGLNLGMFTNSACVRANDVMWDAIEDAARDYVVNPAQQFLSELYAEQFCRAHGCGTDSGGRPMMNSGGFGYGPVGSVNDIMGGMLCARGMGCGNNDPY